MNSERSLEQKQQDLMKGYRIGQLHPGFKCELTKTFLGNGGQSPIGVYEGINTTTKEKYAIKRLDLNDSVTCETLEEFDRIKDLQHANLIRYYGIDVGIGADSKCSELWLVMELCQKDTLRDLSMKGLQPRRVIEIGEQILSGLEYLHAARIVHRDLKGQNVLLDFEGRVKLADFGLSRRLQDTTTVTGEIETDEGTWRYMAPEAMNPTWARIGRRSDMWSFGCVLIEMITKHVPRYAVDKDGRERVTNRNQAIFFIGNGNRPTFGETEFSGTYCKKQVQLLMTMMDKCFQKYPYDRATATELLQFVKKPSSSRTAANDFEDSITVRPSLQERLRRVNHTATLARLASWSLEDKVRPGRQNSTSSPMNVAASTSVRLQQMLATTSNTGLPNVATYRSSPFKFAHYIMVDLCQDLSPQRFIMQYMDDFLANPHQPNNPTPTGILLECMDSELHQYQKNVKMELEMGTLGSLKRREYHTLIVWPNCAAGGSDKLTTKRQLEDAFSIRATRLILVIQSKTQKPGAGEITTRSKWRFLIEDARNAKRLLRM